MFQLIYYIILSLYLLAVPTGAQSPGRSPSYNYAFQFPLPIPPTKTPLTTYTNPRTGTPIDFYEVEVKQFKKRLFPNLQDATLVGYDGMVPGPTFRMERGREALIRVVNNGVRSSVVHVHGSQTRAPWDGWAHDEIKIGQYKDYYMPSKQGARTLWYHDHMAFLTTLNVYSGQSGFYIIQDTPLEKRIGLPTGKYDIPLLLTSHYFTDDGDISDESTERTSIYGDTFLVNGQILPYVAVEPRKYRFRVLNAAISRTLNLSLTSEKGEAVPEIWVVASDGGFMARPVKTSGLVVSMAERWEIIIDFVSFEGRNITLSHKTLFADVDHTGSDTVMQFRVARSVSNNEGNNPLPAKLVDLMLPKNAPTVERTFQFDRRIGQPWTINGKTFSDPQNRILANPSLGATEKWTLKGAGGWSHPVHAHLIDFLLLERGVGNPNQKPGRRYLEEYEKGAIKDIATLGENEAVTVLAKFVPWEGVYSFHCHNIVHEDFEMMAAFNVTKLQDFGYSNLTSGFEDPMDPRFRARIYAGTDIRQVRSEVLPYYAALNAYPDPVFVEQKVDEVIAEPSSNTPPSPTPPGSPPVPRPNKRCGKGFGDSPCLVDECCSPYGWCGTTAPYCADGTADGRCGSEGNGKECPEGECCSKYSWCGSGEKFCGAGCQSGLCS